MLHLTSIFAQQSLHFTVPLMSVTKLASPPYITSYLPLSDIFPNTAFWSLVDLWVPIKAKTEIINCWHNSRNKNGKYLTDFFSSEKMLACLKIKFQKRNGNYICLNNSCSLCIAVYGLQQEVDTRFLNCEANSSFEGRSSDHRIVSIDIRLSLRLSLLYDWSSFVGVSAGVMVSKVD